MSYTSPQHVDTKEQAVLALASTIKGEAVTGGDGSVNRALDILADVLAEQDVQVPQTNAGAILALAQYVTGGGGGGGIEWTTVLDVDATFTYTAGGSYSQSLAAYDDAEVVIQAVHGDVLVMELNGSDALAIGDSIGISSENLQVEMGGNTYWMAFTWSADEGLMVMLTADFDGADATLEAWCANPHHLTIKKCNVLA